MKKVSLKPCFQQKVTIYFIIRGRITMSVSGFLVSISIKCNVESSNIISDRLVWILINLIKQKKIHPNNNPSTCTKFEKLRLRKRKCIILWWHWWHYIQKGNKLYHFDGQPQCRSKDKNENLGRENFELERGMKDRKC